MYDNDSDESLLGGTRISRSRLVQLKTIALAAVTILFLVSLSLLIWQAVLNAQLRKEIDSGGKLPGPYSWLSSDITSKMDTSADPCTDFYQYVCGGYEAHTSLGPDELMRYDVFSGVDVTNAKLMNTIVDAQWPLIGDFMSSCMANASERIPIAASQYAATVNEIITPLTSTDLRDVLPVLAKLHQIGADPFFVPGVLDNIFVDDSDNFLLLEMSGLSYPPFYYEDMPPVLLQRIMANINISLLVAYGIRDNTRAQNVYNLEAALAAITPVTHTFEEALFEVSFSDFAKLASPAYLSYPQAIGAKIVPEDTVLISVPMYFQNLTAFIANTTLQTLTDYLAYRMVVSSLHYPVLHSNVALEQYPRLLQRNRHKFVDLSILNSAAAPTLKASCKTAVVDLLGDFVGLLFSTMVVDDDVRDNVKTLTTNIQNAFRNGLSDLTWITAESKQNATKKLNDIIQIIGHPNKFDRYRGLVLDPDNFLYNVFLISRYKLDDSLAKIGKPFNRSNFEFDATIVNAFYSPFTNTINFPAGILESPMFSSSFPKMLQYARMGYVIGHEITHGFDNTGRGFSGHGAYIGDIMDKESSINFNNQAQCIVDQYNGYYPLPGLHIDGELTLGENIADLGGVKNSFRAYKAWVAANQPEFADHQVVSSLTNDQLFFTMLGQTWCTKATDQGIFNQLSNEHSPGKYRVNGPLSNFDEFAKAFQCSKSSAMVHKPQCVLW